MFKSKIKKICVNLLRLLLIIGIIVSIFSYRTATRKVLDIRVEGITIEKSVNYKDGALNEQQQKAIMENLENYRYVHYALAIKNKSATVRVENLFIYPEFFGDMKNIVFWFDSTDEVVDNMHVYPNSTRQCGRIIVVKSKGLSDEELIKMAKNVRFKLTYDTFKGNSILSLLSYGHSTQVLDYKEK